MNWKHVVLAFAAGIVLAFVFLCLFGNPLATHPPSVLSEACKDLPMLDRLRVGC